MSLLPPKVKKYEKSHLQSAKWVVEKWTKQTTVRQMEQDVAKAIGEWEESGWNHAMLRIRKVVEGITFCMTPTLWDWNLKKLTANLTKKEKKT